MKRLSLGTICLALAFTAAQAAATPINVIANRQVEVGDIGVDVLGPLSPSSALGAFSDSVTANLSDEEVTAEQNSNIGSGGFSGTGSATVGFSVLETEEVFAESLFEVSFDLTSAHNYNLTGNLTANVDGGSALGVFQLLGPTPLGFAAVDFGSQALSGSGVLAPGSYQLTVLALMYPGETIEVDSFMGGSATYDFNFRLEESTTPAPEPGTLALLAFGLMGLGLAGRKRSL